MAVLSQSLSISIFSRDLFTTCICCFLCFLSLQDVVAQADETSTSLFVSLSTKLLVHVRFFLSFICGCSSEISMILLDLALLSSYVSLL